MHRREFLNAAALAIFAAPVASGAQQAAKVYRIGALWLSAPLPNAKPNIPVEFVDALRTLGWVEGQNIAIAHRYAEGRVESFPDLAADLVGSNVDLILAGGGPASLHAARDATKAIPIVMVAASSDPIREGFIQSFARPGGNITGLVTAPEELWGKRLDLLKEAVSGLSRVGVVWDPTATHRAFNSMWKQTEAAARSARVELLAFKANEPADLEGAISGAAKQQVGGLIVMGTPMAWRHRREIADLLTKHRMPAISYFRQQAEAGFLMTYGASLPALFRAAASYVDKILRGAKAADLPVDRPTKFEFVVNLKTAKALGLTIPQSLLLRADEVIQ